MLMIKGVEKFYCSACGKPNTCLILHLSSSSFHFTLCRSCLEAMIDMIEDAERHANYKMDRLTYEVEKYLRDLSREG